MSEPRTPSSKVPPSPLSLSPMSPKMHQSPGLKTPTKGGMHGQQGISAASPTSSLLSMIKTVRSLNPAHLHALEESLVLAKTETTEYRQISESLHKTVHSLEKALTHERRRREELEMQISRIQAEAAAHRHRLVDQTDAAVQFPADSTGDDGVSDVSSRNATIDDVPAAQPVVYSNVNSDADMIYEGFRGKSHAVVYQVICRRTNAQLQVLKHVYAATFSKDLSRQIEKKISGDVKSLLLLLLHEPIALRTRILHDALHGFSVDEDAVVDVLCTATNAEIVQIRQLYSKEYQRLLDEDVQRNTAGDFRTFLTVLLLAQRSTTTEISRQDLAGDAHTLVVAGEGQRFRTESQPFIQIIGTRSRAHLAALNSAYSEMNRSRQDLLSAISKETSGALRKGLLAATKYSIDSAGFWAERAHNALSGFGVDESRVNRYVSLSRETLSAVQLSYRERFQVEMAAEVHKRASGTWKRAIVHLLETSPPPAPAPTPASEP